jgi:hypothetical protein
MKKKLIFGPLKKIEVLEGAHSRDSQVFLALWWMEKAINVSVLHLLE